MFLQRFTIFLVQLLLGFLYFLDNDGQSIVLNTFNIYHRHPSRHTICTLANVNVIIILACVCVAIQKLCTKKSYSHSVSARPTNIAVCVYLYRHYHHHHKSSPENQQHNQPLPFPMLYDSYSVRERETQFVCVYFLAGFIVTALVSLA